MFIDAFLTTFRSHQQHTAVVYQNEDYSYGWLLEQIEDALAQIQAHSGLGMGRVVALDADYSPHALAWCLALMEAGAVLVPMTETFRAKKPEFYEIAEEETEVHLDVNGTANVQSLDGVSITHDITKQLREQQHPGIVIFSSGSTGKSKAAVHDCTRLLKKFSTPRKPKRTIPFMLFDHIGGINTVLHTFSSAGAIVLVEDRTPKSVLQTIADHGVQVMPTSPTFLNLMLLSGDYQNYDLSSLEVLAYGAEPMPESTLQRLHKALPDVQLMQNYGLSELGVMHTKSESSDSLWVKIGGDGFNFRINDGILEIKSESAMLGYLNAPTPFTEDGWFITGDRVEVKGEYMKILGRDSEMINVGGEKVFPAEVEGVIAQMDGVVDVVVSGEAHAITGNIVRATVKLSTDEKKGEFRKRMTAYLSEKLPTYKIPQKVAITEQDFHGDRFKKIRKGV